MPDLTHAQLVAVAARWLHGTRRCAVVAAERTAVYADEHPDAIGWRSNGASILVEAKTSVADYVADLRKPHRAGPGMGRERWYLTPWGLLAGRALEAGWPSGWGLLGIRNEKVYRVVEAVARGPVAGILAAELPLLVAVARRGEPGRGVKLSAPAPEVCSACGVDPDLPAHHGSGCCVCAVRPRGQERSSMADPRTWLIGETNPYQDDPEQSIRYAMYPDPPESAGARLCNLILGMRERDYLRSFERRNLLAGKWSAPLARASAACLTWEMGDGDVVLMLGRKVFEAFVPELSEWPLYGRITFPVRRAVPRLSFVALPHPSGLNRYWNGVDRALGMPSNPYARCRAEIAQHVPHLAPLLAKNPLTRGRVAAEREVTHG